MKLYSVLYNHFHPLNAFFPDWECCVIDSPNAIDEPGILIIHGGSDISPSLYNKGRSSASGASSWPSRRDAIEWACLHGAKEKGVIIFGICRGAQMLCAAAGGYLIQDVTNHAGADHLVEDSDGYQFEVNSLHHQMQAPWDTNHEIIAQSTRPLSRHYLDVDIPVQVPCEPEAVLYPDLNGFGVQWHPEYLDSDEPSNQWVRKVFKERFNL
jgi:putative glutamine amidotransferase